MDGKKIEGFNEIWERVSAASGGAVSRRRGDTEILRGFIQDEACSAAFYAALAKKARGEAETLRALEAGARGHLLRLQAAHFLLTGDTHTPQDTCPAVTGVLDSLRAVYRFGREAAENYAREAKLEGDADLAALYAELAVEESRQAEAIRKIVERILS